MKKCSRCDEVKPYGDFNKCSRNKDGLHTYCRKCHKAHYQSNKVRHRSNVKRVREEYKRKTRKLILEALSSGCTDCGIQDIRVLDFDHVRGTKVNDVSTLVRNGTRIPLVLDEIAKCVVRCKNCHAIKTYERLGGTWHNEYLAPVSSLASNQSLTA